ncbi:TonB-dependent receptor [Porticoccus litoralis]|uniref:TonB-dependent receptor n=1 Tax=Porticoccus litoralis TaxID=434086 RepID=A0AAW8B3E1_9GAMM|nr:TonB-dependent receptor [Porticoccus litoralis]MDP1519643.1 TonB-dependent receptor [Porticoccus litoralis]
MKFCKKSDAIIGALFFISGLFATQALSATAVEEVVVTAEFRGLSLLETGSSISVIDDKTIERRGATHIEQILNLAPNVNFSSGSSRGKYVQIRGIGDRSQFVAPMNPSVGLLIDGIDFSGVGGAATTLDLQQIEILRGPQGTLYGANALAGLINIRSNDPTDIFEGSVETTIAEYETRTTSAVLSGPISESMGYRLAVQGHRTDGYIDNDYLNRHDTSNLDELTARGKLDWRASDDWQVNLTAFYLDADNGYDDFSLDNTRHTLSDQPGVDRQESTALAIENSWRGFQGFDVIGLVSYAENNLEYSFDEDWTYSDICAGQPCDGWAYSSFDRYLRDRENGTVDIRLVSKDDGRLFRDSTDWVLGFYYRFQDESLLREYTYASGDFKSDFETRNRAIYGQLGSWLTDNLKLTSGLRLEFRNAEYEDSDLVNHDNSERLWGGRLGLEYHVTPQTMLYGLVSRGYKAGGVNSDPALEPSARDFDTEYLWNFETGIKGDWLERRLQLQLALFFQKRREMQVKQSLVIPISGSSCPCSFTDYYDNAARGENYGAELEVVWQADERVQLHGSLGLLRATFKDFESYTHVDVDRDSINPVPKDLSGHEQAHAPSYQFAVGVDVDLTDRLTAGLEVEGKESFYLSPRHHAKSNRYELVNARLDYSLPQWTFSLWGRNLADRDVVVRGFGSFGNDPRKFYVTEPYYQFGEPRIVGATAKYRF